MEKIKIASFDLDNLEALIANTVEIKNQLEDLRDENKALAKDGKALDDTFIKNAASIKNLNKAYNANVKVIAEAEQKTAELAAREKLLVVALNQEVKSIDDARASNKLLNQLRNSANATTAEGVEEIRKLNAALDANNEFIKDNVDAYTQQKIGIGGYKDAITEAINELNPLNTSVERGEGSFKKLTAGIKGAAKATLAFIATPLGAFLTVLAGIGLIVKQFFDYNESIKEARILTESLTNTVGDLADTIRNRAGAISEVFGNDFQDNVKAARNLVQAFGISYGEAFDVIEDGLIRGGSKNDEFIRSITEYPKFFADAGFSAQEFINVISQGNDLGIFDDKLQDSLKEFSISINEQTDAAKDALNNAFGAEFTNELFGNIQTGAITVKDALETISKESTRFSLDAQQQAQLTADLFKGAGEDAGGALLIFEAVNNALDDETVTLTELETQIARQLELQKELAFEKDKALKSESIIALQAEFSNFSTWIETVFYKTISGIGDVFNYVFDRQLALLATVGVAFRNAYNLEGTSLEELEATFNSTLDLLESRREAVVELAKRQEQETTNAENAGIAERERLAAEAEARKSARLAEAHERELQKEEDQLARMHEKVAAALERRAEAELQARLDFEDRKRNLENEIELANAEAGLERELLVAEQRFEKDLLELERIEITEQQKTDLLLLIEENREVALAAIKKKYADLAAKEQSKVDKAEIDQRKRTAQSVAQVQNLLVGILTGLLGDSLGAKLAAIAIEAAIDAGAVGIKTAKSNAINLLNATTVAPPPANIGFIAAAGVQNALNTANAGAAITTILSSAAIKGVGTLISGLGTKRKFEKGGPIIGARHSNGGVPIEAEGGEFIFSRKAVNMWGMERLGFMNALAGGNKGVNPSGFFVDGGAVARDTLGGTALDPNDLTEIITDSISAIRVINDPNETLSEFESQQLIVENASI